MTKAKANHLIKSTSPYLLQHAYNPVSWYPWSEEALAEAKRRNVPIILSIGYSSCHWCHVMERESFENEELAGIMNDHFVSIKVDREERPDIDQIYMEAIQTMGIQGGWPLNVFLTPDQKPFYGGTYFPPAQWRQVCLGVSNAYQNNNEQIKESAEQFFQELNHSELKKFGIAPMEVNTDLSEVKKMASALKSRFDPKYGGMDKAPKFPMPAIWKFLLYANVHLKDLELEKHLEHTLTSISNGGIYDQIGGGFARYSVDERWFAPHFEKMLYDNGQLLSLYSEAYKTFPNERYKEVVYDSIDFLEREMMDVSGGFYSALDADSEGVEGLFYIWSEAELKDVLGDDYPLFSDYYHVVPEGNWEHSRNILYKKESDHSFRKRHGIGEEEIKEKVKTWKNKLLMIRSGKVRPGLDDKVLSGWNGLALKGLTDAYRTFGEQKFLDLAVKNASFLKENMIQDAELYRNYKEGEMSIKGYLEDYAFVIDGLIGLYQCDFNKDWLELAKKLADYCLEHFYDSEEGMFFYTANNSERLIARKKEIFDNVIPASNSQMAINLYLLSKFYYADQYEKISQDMLSGMTNLIVREPSYLTNWAILYLFHTVDFPEIAIVGEEPESKAAELDKLPLYNKIIAAGKAGSTLPILRERQAVADKNTIYVCFNKTCKLPVHTFDEAKKQLSIE